VVTSDTLAAPVAPLAAADAPIPLAPVKTTTVSDWSWPVNACCCRTRTSTRAVVARAVQISDVPSCTLTRRTRVHDRPAPEIVTRCADPVGPSELPKATSSAPAGTLNRAVVRVPNPSEYSTR
jgi:hypothetical protein